jgi:hypothetical protein
MKDKELETLVRIRISVPVWGTDKCTKDYMFRTNLVKDGKGDDCTFPQHFKQAFVLQSRIECTWG